MSGGGDSEGMAIGEGVNDAFQQNADGESEVKDTAPKRPWIGRDRSCLRTAIPLNETNGKISDDESA